MAKPPKLQPMSTAELHALGQFAGQTGADPLGNPAGIATTWDTYRDVLSATVPANVRRVHAAIRAMAGRR